MRVIDFEDHVARELDRASYTPQRFWLRRVVLVLVVLAGIVAAVAILTGWVGWLALLLVAAALLAFVVWAYFERAYRSRSHLRAQLQAGLQGQRLIPQVLAFLDNRYYLINSLKLPERADDIDHIVVGPTGILAIEAKNHRGRIFRQNGQWVQSKISHSGRLQPDSALRDPTQQLKRNIDYLRSCINQTDPALARRTRLWIEGVVVFTHPAVSLDLSERGRKALPFPVIKARDLPTHVVGQVPRRAYSGAEVRQIVSLFAHLKSAQRERRNA